MQITVKYKLDYNIPLTKGEKESLIQILSSGCRQNTKDRIEDMITFDHIPYRHYILFNRFICEEERNCVVYCAGQSYPDEIRLVRNILLDR